MNKKKHIASMLIAWRYAKKQTQSKVAKNLGVTFQQIQKYEDLTNGISSVRLLDFCDSYDIPLQQFQTGDCFSVLDGADISILKKEQAMKKIETLKLDEVENDKSGSDENMAGQGFGQGTYL